MRNTTTRTAAAAVTAAAALALGLTAPASAESIGVSDPADINHGVDLLSTEVRNNEHRAVVVLTHTNLRRDPSTGAGGAVFIDTDRSDKGPERVLLGGFFEGTDYVMLRTEGFARKSWGAPVKGFYEMSLDYDKEHTTMRLSRKSLGGADDIRVAVRVSGQRTDGTTLTDWLGEPRSFTPWVARG